MGGFGDGGGVECLPLSGQFVVSIEMSPARVLSVQSRLRAPRVQAILLVTVLKPVHALSAFLPCSVWKGPVSSVGHRPGVGSDMGAPAGSWVVGAGLCHVGLGQVTQPLVCKVEGTVPQTLVRPF